MVEPRRVGVRYDLEHWGDRCVIRTNADGAIDFKLMWAPEDDPSAANWTDWMPTARAPSSWRPRRSKDHLVRRERVNANTRLVITRKDDLSEHEIVQPEEAYALGLQGGYEFDTTTLRFVYTVADHADADLRLRHGHAPEGAAQDPGDPVGPRPRATMWPAACSPRRRTASRCRSPSCARRDTPIDGSAPLLLYGYGSYGYSMDPSFSIRNLSLVDRGWIWATAHIRGGSEKGWGWFLDGRKDKKTNTFTDFIACAEHLIGERLWRSGEGGGLRRLGRRPADGRGRQSAARPLGRRSSPRCRSWTC